MLSQKNLLRILINTGLGVIFIIFWLKLVDVREVGKQIATINPLRVLPFIFFFALSSVIRAVRLKALLSEFNIKTYSLVALNFLSQLLSFTIPLRLGEISKGVYLSTEYNLPITKSLIWIFLDRFLDFWLVLVLAGALLIFIPTNLPANLQSAILILILLSSFGAVFVVFLPLAFKKIVRVVSYILILASMKKIITKISDFIVDASSLLNQSPKKIFLILFLTFLALLSDGFSWFVLFLAVGVNLDFLKVFLGSLLSSLTYLIPAAPGYVGSAEAAGLAVFSYGLGLEKTMVSVVTVVNHALALVCILVFGILSLYLLKFNLNLVFKKLKSRS